MMTRSHGFLASLASNPRPDSFSLWKAWTLRDVSPTSSGGSDGGPGYVVFLLQRGSFWRRWSSVPEALSTAFAGVLLGTVWKGAAVARCQLIFCQLRSGAQCLQSLRALREFVTSCSKFLFRRLRVRAARCLSRATYDTREDASFCRSG